MERQVRLSICGTQKMGDDAPETMELVTPGVLSVTQEGVRLRYEETELTGMRGTMTEFLIAPDCVTLTRSGELRSRMIFAPGHENRSLYDLGFGALMLTVHTERIDACIDENGGTLELAYRLAVEEQTAGTVECRIEVRPLE